jgi:WW domain-containing oxidoreductase
MINHNEEDEMQQQFGAKTTADEVLAGKDLQDQTIIVTGANTGIGYETARALAAAGAKVIFACRNSNTGEAAVARVQKQHPNSRVQFLRLDLASVASIREFCDSVQTEKIDVLICNAGLAPTRFQETEERVESTVGICHFGHFLLTKILLPRLLARGSSRVVMVSSESHRMPKTLEFERLPLNQANFKFMVAYGQAKLCNVLFANELQRRYGNQGMTACSLHPGTLVTTEIGRDSKLMTVLMNLISPFTKTPNQGAATTVYCATHEPAADLQGQYFSHCQNVRSPRDANDPATAKRLWDLSEQWCEQV